MGKKVKNSIHNIKYNPPARFDCATISTNVLKKLYMGIEFRVMRSNIMNVQYIVKESIRLYYE